jgi:hypothetical protein
MDAEARIAALDNPEMDWPLGGSFAEMRTEEDDGETASIHVEFTPEDDTDVAV